MLIWRSSNAPTNRPRKKSDPPQPLAGPTPVESLHAAHSATRQLGNPATRQPGNPETRFRHARPPPRAGRSPDQPLRPRLKPTRQITSTNKATRVPNSVGTGPFESGSQKDTAAEEHRLRQAKLALERLKVRYDLYKKAGEGVAADDPLIPTLSPMVVIDRPLDAEAAAKLIWDKVGLKFGEPVTAEKIGSQGKKYRGGMPIVEVRDAESAEKKAFSKGDLLVGLDQWETTSLNNVVWILKQFETVPKPDQTDWIVKFFVIREGATKYGFLRVEGQPTGTSKIAPPQSTTKSLDEWLVILRNDRDRQQVINAVRGVTSQATAADAERAMSALLAAAEFVDFSDQTQASVVQELI